MRLLTSTLVLAALIAAPDTAWGQAPRASSRWSLEFTGDASFPSGKLGNAELDTGVGFGASLRVRLHEHLLAYGGWEWHWFSSDQLAVAQSIDVEETGYTFGLRFEHPFKSEEVTSARRLFVPGYWLRAGGLFDHLELENEDGDIIDDTDHGLGWEAGAGVTLPIARRLALTPGIRYRALSRELTLGSATRDVSLKYVTAMVGIAIKY